jgi:hypothetical protein
MLARAKELPMAKADDSIPYKEMKPAQKAVFVFKILVCIITFGMIFPTVGD